jgi:hypothetical protein
MDESEFEFVMDGVTLRKKYDDMSVAEKSQYCAQLVNENRKNDLDKFCEFGQQRLQKALAPIRDVGGKLEVEQLKKEKLQKDLEIEDLEEQKAVLLEIQKLGPAAFKKKYFADYGNIIIFPEPASPISESSGDDAKYVESDAEEVAPVEKNNKNLQNVIWLGDDFEDDHDEFDFSTMTDKQLVQWCYKVGQPKLKGKTAALLVDNKAGPRLVYRDEGQYFYYKYSQGKNRWKKTILPEEYLEDIEGNKNQDDVAAKPRTKNQKKNDRKKKKKASSKSSNDWRGDLLKAKNNM